MTEESNPPHLQEAMIHEPQFCMPAVSVPKPFYLELPVQKLVNVNLVLSLSGRVRGCGGI